MNHPQLFLKCHIAKTTLFHKFNRSTRKERRLPGAAMSFGITELNKIKCNRIYLIIAGLWRALFAKQYCELQDRSIKIHIFHF